MNIIPLRKEQKNAAAAVVARAFFNYPSLKAYFPDESKRKGKLTRYMEHVLQSAMQYGEVLTTEDLSGVMFLLPPGHTRLTDWEFVKAGFITAPLIVGLGHYGFVNTCEVFLADTQERLLQGRPHYYLWGLAVDPDKQRSGAGSTLLKRLSEQADREQMPIYLETHQFANVAYYEQRGFQLIHTGEMPGDHLPFWCMLREPDATKA